jgi:hypothetical protein
MQMLGRYPHFEKKLLALVLIIYVKLKVPVVDESDQY